MITRKFFAVLITGLVCIISGFLSAQPIPVKWGKVTDKEREMTVCFIDSSASAVYLCTFGTLSFGHSNISITTHIRLKILTQEGKKYADVEIPFYTRNNLEKIINVKAQTINFGQDGNQTVKKVENGQIFSVDEENNWKTIRFTFPGVEVGSILEYEYTLVSENYTFLEGWIFQENEPVLHSEFRATFVEGLDYIILMSGERLLKKYSNQTSMDSWVLNNLEPLRDEPYCFNRYDYADRIRFQLSGYKKASDGYSSSHENFALTWKEMIRELEEVGSFNEMFTRSGRVSEIIKEIDLTGKNEPDKIEELHKYVVNKFTWNGNYRLIPNQSLSQLLESRSGSSCELNLLLKLMLKEAGIEASALMLSTRRNGRLTKIYPLLSQFNHIMLYCQVGEKKIFMDATSPYRSYTVPDLQDLGQEGLVVDSGKEEWVMIEPEHKSRKDFLVTMDLKEGDSTRISLSSLSSGFIASRERQDYKTTDEKKWFESLVFQGDLELHTLTVENLDQISLPLKIKAEVRGTFGSSSSGFLYIRPYLADDLRENPFKGRTRFLPVELPYEFTEHYVVNISMPEGYQIAEIPKDEFHELSNRWGSFTYQCKLISRNIQVVVDIKFNRMIFPKSYYRPLSDFHSIISEKLNEMIVLKKTSL